MKQRRLPSGMIMLAMVLVAAVAAPLLLRRTKSKEVVVVYCAHDSVFADEILRQFETQTGIQVDVRYDEEANKSLGLTNLLLSEKNSPRCDVFWNNQTHGTIRLANAGVLAPSDPTLFERIPTEFRDAKSRWCGFAGRLRVCLINTEKLANAKVTAESLLAADDLSSGAIAVPLFGTTLTHYAVVAETNGLEALQKWHSSIHQRGIHEARGNGAVKDLVATGTCAWGLTDTDDAFAAIDAGASVRMLPVRLSNQKTICIPNTVSIIQGAPHPENANRLIAFLLSEETELALAKSKSRQIPLGPVRPDQLPEDDRQLADWAKESVSPGTGATQDTAVLDWLSTLYSGGK